MDARSIASLRLQAQQISVPEFTTIEDMVSHMGALQAQDLAMVKWAIGTRLPGTTESDVDEAFAKGRILRTHLLRPTWHVVAAEDLHWVLELSAPQIKKTLSSRHKQLEITPKLAKKSNDVICQTLDGEIELTREELVAALEKAGIDTSENRASHFFLLAELEGLICSGSAKGSKQNYALLSERVPYKHVMAKEEALATLAWRYFTSHGPATCDDFIWWSGLKITDAKEALALVKTELQQEAFGDKTYWFAQRNTLQPADDIYLLPAYDEFIISYKDRSAILSSTDQDKVISRNGIFWPSVLVKGKVQGLWKRKLNKKSVLITLDPFEPLLKKHQRNIEKKGALFAKFLTRQMDIKIDNQ